MYRTVAFKISKYKKNVYFAKFIGSNSIYNFSSHRLIRERAHHYNNTQHTLIVARTHPPPPRRSIYCYWYYPNEERKKKSLHVFACDRMRAHVAISSLRKLNQSIVFQNTQQALMYNFVASCVNKTAHLLYAAMGQGHHDTLMMMGVKLMRRGGAVTAKNVTVTKNGNLKFRYASKEKIK